MVKSADEASQNYREGIQPLESAYKEAARADTPKEAAEALQRAAGKGEHLSISDMVRKYEDAYS